MRRVGTCRSPLPEGSAHKNRMQGNDYVTSAMYKKGVRCWACHDVHGTDYPADVPGNALCIRCHTPRSEYGPRERTIEEHTRHAADSTGSSCIECHMPKIAITVGNENVRSHTFRFISPAQSGLYKIPNPCTSCHAGKSTEWANAELLKWDTVSPWRTAE
jgi:predicted CXXCH cytochrome family protein